MAHMLQQDAPAVQAVACEGLAKLMLSGMLYDKTVRKPQYGGPSVLTLPLSFCKI